MHWDAPFYWCNAVTIMQKKRTCWSCHLDLCMAHLCCQSTRKQSTSISWTDPWLSFGCLEQVGVLNASGIKGNSLPIYSDFTTDSYKIPCFDFFFSHHSPLCKRYLKRLPLLRGGGGIVTYSIFNFTARNVCTKTKACEM